MLATDMPTKDEMFAFFRRFREMEAKDDSCGTNSTGPDSESASVVVTSTVVTASDCDGQAGDSPSLSHESAAMHHHHHSNNQYRTPSAPLNKKTALSGGGARNVKVRLAAADIATQADEGFAAGDCVAASLLTQVSEGAGDTKVSPSLRLVHPPATPRQHGARWMRHAETSYVLNAAASNDGTTATSSSLASSPKSVRVLKRGSRLRESLVIPSPSCGAPSPCKFSLLPPLPIDSKPPITLVLDVDETLVHSTFSPNDGPHDLEIPITHNGHECTVYVKLRPYLQEFLDFVATRFEVVIFTASMSVYCNPLMDLLDPTGRLGSMRLFREHCTKADNTHIKDLTLLGRSLERVAIVDNSPAAYYFQPRNAIPIVSWFNDKDDTELLKLLPLLANLSTCDNVYTHLDDFGRILTCNTPASVKGRSFRQPHS